MCPIHLEKTSKFNDIVASKSENHESKMLFRVQRSYSRKADIFTHDNDSSKDILDSCLELETNLSSICMSCDNEDENSDNDDMLIKKIFDDRESLLMLSKIYYTNLQTICFFANYCHLSSVDNEKKVTQLSSSMSNDMLLEEIDEFNVGEYVNPAYVIDLKFNDNNYFLIFLNTKSLIASAIERKFIDKDSIFNELSSRSCEFLVRKSKLLSCVDSVYMDHNYVKPVSTTTKDEKLLVSGNHSAVFWRNSSNFITKVEKRKKIKISASQKRAFNIKKPTKNKRIIKSSKDFMRTILNNIKPNYMHSLLFNLYCTSSILLNIYFLETNVNKFQNDYIPRVIEFMCMYNICTSLYSKAILLYSGCNHGFKFKRKTFVESFHILALQGLFTAISIINTSNRIEDSIEYNIENVHNLTSSCSSQKAIDNNNTCSNVEYFVHNSMYPVYYFITSMNYLSIFITSNILAEHTYAPTGLNMLCISNYPVKSKSIYKAFCEKKSSECIKYTKASDRILENHHIFTKKYLDSTIIFSNINSPDIDQSLIFKFKNSDFQHKHLKIHLGMFTGLCIFSSKNVDIAEYSLILIGKAKNYPYYLFPPQFFIHSSLTSLSTILNRERLDGKYIDSFINERDIFVMITKSCIDFSLKQYNRFVNSNKPIEQ